MVGHQNGLAIGSEGEPHGIFAHADHLLLAMRIGHIDYVDQPLRHIANQEFRTVGREARFESGLGISLERNRYGYPIGGRIDDEDLGFIMIHRYHVLSIRRRYDPFRAIRRWNSRDD